MSNGEREKVLLNKKADIIVSHPPIDMYYRFLWYSKFFKIVQTPHDAEQSC